jgi:branched-chain amino acid transport system permease protein
MTLFFQLVLSGLGFGGIYAIAALGLTLIFKTSNVVNFGYGAMATVVSMLVWTLHSSLKLPIAASWLLAVVAGGLLGVVVETAFMRRVQASAIIVSIVMTVGLLLLIEGLTGLAWGFQPKPVPPVLSGPSVTFGSFAISRNDVFIAGLTVILGLALYVFYEHTRFGLAVRAVAGDAETASLMGISRRWVISLSWAAGIAVTGAAATLAAPAVGLTPTFMENIAVFAFAAAVLGGFGSLLGAVVGGFLIGILSNLVAGYLSANLQLTLMFALIVATLYVRPEGLFSRGAEVRP